LKDLLSRQFKLKGQQSKPVKLKEKVVKIPAAPPFVSGYGQKETGRIRALLLKQFDLAAVEAPPAEVKAKKTKAPAQKKKRTLKDLLFTQFEAKGKQRKPVKIKEKMVKIPTAPPFVSGYGKKAAEQVRALLFQQFNLPIAPPVQKKASVSAKDLLFKKFEGAAVTAVKIEKASVAIPEAPPFISGYGKEETEKIRALLLKQFAIAKGEAVKMQEPLATAQTVPSYEPAPDAATSDPMAMGKKMALCALIALVAILIGASYSNRGNYYLREADGVVQVWQGKFAPSGEEMILTLDGVTMPEDGQPVYSKQEISPLVFDYLLGSADALLDASQGPDFGAIKKNLFQATDFAPTPVVRTRVENRLRGIDFIVLFHKADIAIGKGTLPDFKDAKAYLARARSAAYTEYQRDIVKRTETVVDEAIAASAK